MTLTQKSQKKKMKEGQGLRWKAMWNEGKGKRTRENGDCRGTYE